MSRVRRFNDDVHAGRRVVARRGNVHLQLSSPVIVCNARCETVTRTIAEFAYESNIKGGRERMHVNATLIAGQGDYPVHSTMMGVVANTACAQQ